MIKNEVKDKKLFFTVATGRCGTAFFSEILRLVPGAVSLHEPDPEYAEVLRDVQTNPEIAHNFLVEKKLPAIARERATIYIETSHLFCKGFLEQMLELEIIPSLFWIRRDHRAVASSMFRGGTIPGRTEKGLRFYLSPDDFDVLPLAEWEKKNDYQLCYWYCLEIERRGRVYREMYIKNGWSFTETSLSEVTTVRGMNKLLDDLELPGLSWYGWLRYLNNRRRKVNPTAKAKQRVALPEGLDDMEREVRTLTGQI